MCKFIDMTNKKFGKLTVLELSHYDSKRKNFMWRCVCDCGNKIVSSGDVLRRGHVKSCGCINSPKRYWQYYDYQLRESLETNDVIDVHIKSLKN